MVSPGVFSLEPSEQQQPIMSLEFLVVLPSITRGYRPTLPTQPAGNTTSPNSIDGDATPFPYSRMSRSNSNQSSSHRAHRASIPERHTESPIPIVDQPSASTDEVAPSALPPTSRDVPSLFPKEPLSPTRATNPSLPLGVSPKTSGSRRYVKAAEGTSPTTTGTSIPMKSPAANRNPPSAYNIHPDARRASINCLAPSGPPAKRLDRSPSRGFEKREARMGITKNAKSSLPTVNGSNEGSGMSNNPSPTETPSIAGAPTPNTSKIIQSAPSAPFSLKLPPKPHVWDPAKGLPSAVERMMPGNSGIQRRAGERASMAGIMTANRVRGTATGRPGWEAEEIVGVLREDGMLVTTFRSQNQLSKHLRNLSNPEFLSNRVHSLSNFPTKLQSQIVLVPLSDSPTLPSLSLLLAQGTTPSAICFQQDLLDRARRTEKDWLPSALEIINVAIQEISAGSFNQERIREDREEDEDKDVYIHVIAYSANPALASSVVDECLKAGAIGVLQPPYDVAETLDRIRKMISYAERSRAVHDSFDRIEPEIDVDVMVKKMEEVEEIFQNKMYELDIPDEDEENEVEATIPAFGTEPARTLLSKLSAYDLDSRRRSVDNGGLALSIQRASRSKSPLTHNQDPDRLLAPDEAPVLKQNRSRSLAGLEMYAQNDEEEEQNGLGSKTAIAELLGEMYRQTRIAIEIQMVDYEEFASPLTAEHRARLVEALSTWDFRPHALNEADLFRCACLLFESVLRIEGLHELGIQRDQLNRLLFAIRAIYHAPNPYHNYIHAVDVLQASYSFLIEIGVAPPLSVLLDESGTPWKRTPLEEQGDLEEHSARLATQRIFRPQDVLAVMVAAMGHDVGHPGLSNVFMKNAKTPLSLVYEDKSVLENMHCMLIVQLLRKHGFSFLLDGSHSAVPQTSPSSEATQDSPFTAVFGTTPPPTAMGTTFERQVKEGAIADWRDFKKLVYSTVLATDMGIHFDWIKRFMAFGKRMRACGDEEMTEGEEAEGRVVLLQAIIKCADISNPTRPIEVSEHWSSVLLQEWANQASLEQELALPVSVVATADAGIQAKGQIGFIDLFVLPLFETAAGSMPDLARYAEVCSENRALWQSRYDNLLLSQDAGPVPSIKSPIGELPNAFEFPRETRYQTLFPLSLPRSMVASQSNGSQLSSATALPNVRSTQKSSGTGPIVEGGEYADNQAMRRVYRESVTRRPTNGSFRSKPHLGLA